MTAETKTETTKTTEDNATKFDRVGTDKLTIFKPHGEIISKRIQCHLEFTEYPTQETLVVTITKKDGTPICGLTVTPGSSNDRGVCQILNGMITYPREEVNLVDICAELNDIVGAASL